MNKLFRIQYADEYCVFVVYTYGGETDYTFVDSFATEADAKALVKRLDILIDKHYGGL